MGQSLQDFKKRQNLTNKDVGRALHCSASKAGMILQGRYISVYDDHDIQQLANVLGITFERCWLAMCESRNEWAGTPGKEYMRASEFRALVQREHNFPVEEPRPITIVDAGIRLQGAS